MKLSLHCTPNIRGVLQELLLVRNIEIDEQSHVCLVETGLEIPKGKISMVFELANLGQLIEILDQLRPIGDESPNTIIGKFGDDSFQIIPYSQIYYFEARGNNVFCIAAGPLDKAVHEYKMKEKLYELEARLPQNRFLRVGKSHIANIENKSFLGSADA